ncbi:MAG TPA: PqqD family protein [Caulobacteraceae bacterium]|jgi:hypothetical protein|nr:PqqD family protein [Caulobacteraceae bacterium]
MIKRSQGWLAAQVGDELVMMSAESGSYIGLNNVGARVRELLEAPADFSQICATLTGEFDVSEDTCRAEVESFLADLEKRGAITRSA